MNKNEWKGAIRIGLLFTLLWTSGACAEKDPSVTAETDYYTALIKECRSKTSVSCCMASLKVMIRNKYKLAPPQGVEGCPAGYQPNMMRCIDSYRWCQPEKPEAGSKQGD